MPKPPKAAQILKNSHRISILAGDKKISDMLVFLLYRKLTGKTKN